MDLAEALECEPETFLPRLNANRSPGTVLRATAKRLASTELAAAIDDLLCRAEAHDMPERALHVGAAQPAYAANELLEKAGIVDPPVPVDVLAERCGVLVLYRPLPDALSGLVFSVERGPVIGINSNHSPNRQRFSTAHELGHVLLGHERETGVHQRFHLDVAEITPPGYNWRHERAANDFAADLLMPRRLVATAFEQNPRPARLAKKFKVSELAMGYRLVDLGLR